MFLRIIFKKFFKKIWKEGDIVIVASVCQNLSCDNPIRRKDFLCEECRSKITDYKHNAMVVCQNCGTLVSIKDRARDSPITFVPGCNKCHFGIDPPKSLFNKLNLRG
jgi:uncharacterized protein YlaI